MAEVELQSAPVPESEAPAPVPESEAPAPALDAVAISAPRSVRAAPRAF